MDINQIDLELSKIETQNKHLDMNKIQTSKNENNSSLFKVKSTKIITKDHIEIKKINTQN